MNTAILLLALNAASTTFSLPPGLLTAVCTVESNLHASAVHLNDGSGHSHGLCQIHEQTAKQFYPYITDHDLYDPKINAVVAAAYLRYQYKRYGNWEQALVAYNRGNAKGIKSSKYSRKVMKLWMDSQ